MYFGPLAYFLDMLMLYARPSFVSITLYQVGMGGKRLSKMNTRNTNRAISTYILLYL
jgi:hypothetical protein